jgi:hypothetical protein
MFGFTDKIGSSDWQARSNQPQPTSEFEGNGLCLQEQHNGC